MTFFSKVGQKSTIAERVLFAGVFFIVAATVAPGILETVQINQLFSKANPALLDKCEQVSGYSVWRFWDSRIQEYSVCIVEGKDPNVQNAAGHYLLQGKQGELTVQDNKSASPLESTRP